MHLLQPAATQLLRFAAAGVVDPLPAEVIAIPVARAGPDHLRQRFGQGLEARPAFAQRLDGFAVLGDVDAGAEKAFELTRRTEVRCATLEQPAPRAIVTLQPELLLVGPACIEGRMVGVEHAIEIGRVQVVAPAITQLLFYRAPDEVQPALVEPGAALVGSAHPDQHRRGIRRGAEPQLAFTQRRLGLHASGDVAHERAEHQVFAKTDRRDGQLDGELVPGAMQRRKFHALVEHPRHAGLDIMAQTAAVFIAVTLGNDQLRELASQHVAARPAEQLFRLRVPAGDLAVCVDRDDGVEGGLEVELVPFLGHAQRTLGGAPQAIGAFTACRVDPHECHERDHAGQREDCDRGLEAEGGATLVVDREGAGDQRHDERRWQQPPRHASAHAVAGEQGGDAGIGAQGQCAGTQQQDQGCCVYGHVGDGEQRLAAKQVTGYSQPAHEQRRDRDSLVQQRGAPTQRENQRQAEHDESTGGGGRHACGWLHVDPNRYGRQ